MSELHDVAARLEAIAHSEINKRIHRSLFDERRVSTTEAIAHLRAYADERRAEIAATPGSLTDQLECAEKLLESPELPDAVRLIQADYTEVRQSGRFCTVLERYSGRGDIRLRVEHCPSGIYMACTREFDGYDQKITRVSTNLEDGQSMDADRACPINNRQLPRFTHLHQPSWSPWTPGSTTIMGGDPALGLQRVWRYTRMGIGSEVYLRGHCIFPNARWIGRGLFDEGHAVRESLHRRSPWHWEAPRCAVCGISSDTANVSWAESSRRDLAAAHEAAAPSSLDHMSTG